jgi:hypothetical protein
VYVMKAYVKCSSECMYICYGGLCKVRFRMYVCML